MHRQPRLKLPLVLALVTALAIALLAAPAQAALRHVDGTVLSKDSENRTFRIVTENGNRLRIKVNSTTRFERIGGFAALRKGLAIEVDAQRTANGLLARQVELQGGGGSGGGSDDGGGDDHGGGGSDDGPNHT